MASKEFRTEKARIKYKNEKKMAKHELHHITKPHTINPNPIDFSKKESKEISVMHPVDYPNDLK